MTKVIYNPKFPSFDRDEFLTPFDRMFDHIVSQQFPEIEKQIGVKPFKGTAYPKINVYEWDTKVGVIAEIPGLSLDAPGGAFYALIECAGIIGAVKPDGSTIKNDVDFVAYVLDEAKVASVPGSAYGVAPFFRLSTANSEEKLTSAMQRISDAVSKLALQNN